MASASGYNYHRFARAVLKKARKWEPSLSIQLYPTHWRFENSVSVTFQSGPAFPSIPEVAIMCKSGEAARWQGSADIGQARSALRCARC